MQLQAFSTRIYLLVALSLFFISATYLFWSGGHERFIPSFHPKPPTVPPVVNPIDDAKEEPWHAPPINETANEAPEPVSTSTPISSLTTSSSSLPSSSPKPASNDGEVLIMDEFNGAPIREMCDKTSWNSTGDMIIGCGARVGGVGNVRQEILVCVRHAIEIGAGLVRPTVMLRSEGLIEYQNGPVQNMSYLFELEKFDERLKASCPQMKLYEDIEEVEKLGEVVRILKPRVLPDDGNKDWNGFKKWANENRQQIGKITVLDVDLVFGQTPVCLDSPEFIREFGGLVELREDAQKLASTALSEISTRFKLPSPKRLGVTEDLFVGVHLRTEIDAMAVGYTSFEAQAAAYTKYINATSLRVVYAASGNTTSLELFAQQAATLTPPAQVVTKHDLLSGKDAELLGSMTWDQQALVDYLILEKSSRFLGVSDSSFSWGLVYARQPFSDTGLCNTTVDLPEGTQFEDDLSAIFGGPRDWHIHKLWP